MTIRKISLLALGVLAAPGMLFAQTNPMGQNRAPEKGASQIMVTAFKSAERGPTSVGAAAAEEMRKKMENAFSAKQVFVIPVERVNPQLIASQFSTTEGLEPYDARALAVMLRADAYIAGVVERVPAGGFKTSADLVLTRDNSARQPLGTTTAPKLDDAITLLVKELKESLKQLDGERQCTNAARDKKFPEAIGFAQAAIAAYPKSTLARMCLVSVLDVSKAPATEVSKVARELVALDPRSNVGLGYLAKTYREAKQSDSLVVTLTNMIRNDPKNTDLQRDAINEIALEKNPGLARPIIDSAVALNPGDSELLKLRWSILFAMKDYKEMFKQGEELAKLDTAFADTTYFQRTSNTYAADSQWQKAAEYAARGLAKFPTNATLAGVEIQVLQKAGQPQQALEKLRAAKANKIPVPNQGTQELLLLKELNMGPELVTVAKQLIAAGDTSTNVRLVLLGQASANLSAAQKADNNIDSLTSVLSLVQYADSNVTGELKSQTAFMLGTTQYLMAAKKGALAGQQKSCPMAKEAKAHMVEAFSNLSAGAKYNPTLMQQLMGAAMQTDPQLDLQIKALCK